MKNSKWGTESYVEKPVHVVLFCSRNKDNNDLDGFVERRKSFISNKTTHELLNDFRDFAKNGLDGEMSRFYYSVNERDMNKVRKELIHFLIDDDEFNLCSLPSKLAGISAKKENAKTKRWMFDFDTEDVTLYRNFIKDISELDNTIEIESYKTPHGYAIVTSRGFDCRTLLGNYKDICTLKRDDLLCVSWITKGKYDDE